MYQLLANIVGNMLWKILPGLTATPAMIKTMSIINEISHTSNHSDISFRSLNWSLSKRNHAVHTKKIELPISPRYFINASIQFWIFIDAMLMSLIHGRFDSSVFPA